MDTRAKPNNTFQETVIQILTPFIVETSHASPSHSIPCLPLYGTEKAENDIRKSWF
jgi:hypothetical protein